MRLCPKARHSRAPKSLPSASPAMARWQRYATKKIMQEYKLGRMTKFGSANRRLWIRFSAPTMPLKARQLLRRSVRRSGKASSISQWPDNLIGSQPKLRNGGLGCHLFQHCCQKTPSRNEGGWRVRANVIDKASVLGVLCLLFSLCLRLMPIKSVSRIVFSGPSLQTLTAQKWCEENQPK